jgi:ATP-dependent RNA helicase RhlE
LHKLELEKHLPTFAFIEIIQIYSGHTPKIVILVPTRELVVQVVEEVEKLTKYMSVRTIGIFGGVNINTQKLLFIKDVTYWWDQEESWI